MPTGFDISLDRYIGREGIGGGYREDERRIPSDFGPAQPMQGFEDTYRNIIDYIVRITHRIWEDRDVTYILDTYSDDSRVFDDYGLQRGNQKIVDDTHHTTGAFSDIVLIADEVIWAGNDQVGYHTSHRTIIRGTNDGDSKYGPATGKAVDVLVIANCVARDNEIFLEHVLYNNSSLLRQLGHDLPGIAERLAIAPPPGWPRDAATFDLMRKATSPVVPLRDLHEGPGLNVDAMARSALEGLWNQQDLSVLETHYAPRFPFTGATERAGQGSDAYGAMLHELTGCFSNLRLQVDEVYWMGNEQDGYLTSERWSATATHDKAGIYGEPTGCPVQIWGITQHRIENGRFTSEWMLFNELDLMMQIAAARSA